MEMRLIGNKLELDGVVVGFIMTDRATAMRVRDWFDEIDEEADEEADEE